MSAQNIVTEFFECFEGVSDKEFTNKITQTIEHLGRNTILNVLNEGLNQVINDEMNDNIYQQTDDDSNIKLQLKSLTTQFKLNYPTTPTAIKLVDILDCNDNHDTLSVLSQFLCINDQINLKQTSKIINKKIHKIDITKHSWIEFNYDMSLDQIVSILKNVHPIIFKKAFDKVKITGVTEYNFEHHYRLMPELNALNLFGDDVDDNPKGKHDQFRTQMSVWFFIISNLCKNNGILITPKLCERHTVHLFMVRLNQHLTGHNPGNDPKISKNYVPRSIIFQCFDGESIATNGVDFYLECLEQYLESMKDLLNHKNIEKLIIARKYKTCDDKLYDIFVKRAVVVYGPEFNVKNKFVTLRKGKDYTIVYLKFTKQLINKYVPRYPDNDFV